MCNSHNNSFSFCLSETLKNIEYYGTNILFIYLLFYFNDSNKFIKILKVSENAHVKPNTNNGQITTKFTSPIL